MTVADLIDQLSEDGTLDCLRDSGLISWKVYLHRDIFRHYQTRMIMGDERTAAVYDAMERFRVSERTVYYAVKAMRKDAARMKGRTKGTSNKAWSRDDPT